MQTLRLDRFATLSLFQPLRRRIARGAGRIPILMYHSISETRNAGAHPYYQTTTAPKVFAEHMKFLGENNYHVIGLGDAVKEIEGPTCGSAKCVVITFDDGFGDFYTQAFPLLNHYGFSATVFLPTAYISEPALRFKGTECLTWTQVRELRKAGVLFGSHTVTHPQLRHAKTEDVRSELRCSRETVEQKLGSPVKSFAYPYAFPETDRVFRHRLQAILQETGYENGVSTIIGTAKPGDNRFFLPRLPINGWDDPKFFQAKLEGGYDWLHSVQYLLKTIRSPNWGPARGGTSASPLERSCRID